MSLSLVVVTLAGCSPTYVLRAAYEEIRILSRREPIEQVLAAGDVDPQVRAKLELTLAVRTFAHDRLGLNVGGSYSSLAKIDQDQVVHVVSASPWDRLAAYTWWFPIVGRIPYRGYFHREDAEALARELESEGYDTYVRSAVAFSTLGWFDDPLLSNMLRQSETSLADTIIHELLHNTIYLAGQAPFNESFATFVGSLGAIEFFTSRGDDARAAEARASWNDALRFSDFLQRFTDALTVAYADGISREQRTDLFATWQQAFKAEPWETTQYDRFAAQPLNNARILQYQMYAQRLELFARVYTLHEHDLAASIRWIRERVADSDDPFAAVEQGLAGTAAAAPAPRAE